jgi:hypothetical protein
MWISYHLNWSASAATVTVRTPPAGSVDSRRVGVNGLGAYWGTGASAGLSAVVQWRTWPSPTIQEQAVAYWAQDAQGRPYVWVVERTLDWGTANQKVSRAEQTVDPWGNVTQVKQYDYGDLTTPKRTYTNTYVTDANYTSRHIRNRLATSTVTPQGGSAVTLVTNLYDGGYLSNVTTCGSTTRPTERASCTGAT